MEIGKQINTRDFVDINIFSIDNDIHIYLFDVGVGLENSVDVSVRSVWISSVNNYENR